MIAASASRDPTLLSDSTGVITTDNDGSRVLRIPSDFCRKMFGELVEELGKLFGIRRGVDYDFIEGDDDLPNALRGQGGVHRDIATVSAFQEKSESDQLS